MKLNKQYIIGIIKRVAVSLLILVITACTDFVEVDPPKNTLVSETVFEDANTVESALANIYVKMREGGMTSGSFGISLSISIYTDELDYSGSDPSRLNFYSHNISASDGTVSGWWSHAYNLIYAANDVIQGVENSTALSLEEEERFKGQALFIRAYLHSLLVTLFGDIPYIATTDYIANNTASRMPIATVYENIIADLILAESLLDEASGERVLPSKSSANGLLARMYLYTENWALAEATASKLIALHNLEPDITKVFLKDSQETLWQFKPGPNVKNTLEAQALIITAIPPPQGYALTNTLLAAFEPDDLRRTNWVGSITDGPITLYYAFKYKETINTTDQSLEYSIIFRIAEQYLIRAEARAQGGDLSGAQQDLNTIRNRAGLIPTTAATTPDLMDAILQEREVELFTEFGQGWFDLKRMGKAEEVLSPIKANWRNTDVLLPIPEAELEVNQNLRPQNLGY